MGRHAGNDKSLKDSAGSIMGMLELLSGRQQNPSATVQGHLGNLTESLGRFVPPVVRATGSQGQDLGFRGFQPSFGGGIDPTAYGPNKPPYISQANQGAYRPDETQEFRDYEGPFAGLATMAGTNPGNPAPGSWEYRGDPDEGYRPYEGPLAQQFTDWGWNPGKAARGSWDYDPSASKGKNGKGATSKSAPGGSFNMMALLRQLAQQQGG